MHVFEAHCVETKEHRQTHSLYSENVAQKTKNYLQLFIIIIIIEGFSRRTVLKPE